MSLPAAGPAHHAQAGYAVVMWAAATRRTL